MLHTKPVITILLRHDIDSSKTKTLYLDFNFEPYKSKKYVSESMMNAWKKLMANRKMSQAIFERIIKLWIEGSSYTEIHTNLVGIEQSYSPKVIASVIQDYCKLMNNKLFQSLIDADDSLSKLLKEHALEFVSYVPNSDFLLEAINDIKESYSGDYMSIDNYDELSQFCDIKRPKQTKQKIVKKQAFNDNVEALFIYQILAHGKVANSKYKSVIIAPNEHVAHSFAVTDPVHNFEIDIDSLIVTKLGHIDHTDSYSPEVLVSSYEHFEE